MKRILTITACLVLLASPSWAQSGPYAAQIQAALRSFLANANTFSGNQTFSGNVSVGGTLGVTGTTTHTGVVLLPDGTVAAPAMAFASNPTTGFYLYGSNVGGLAANGLVVAKFAYTDPIGFAILNGLPLSFAAAGTPDTFVVRGGAAATLQLGQNAAGVIDQMFKGPDRITSDGVGGALYLAGGRNRGASAGGSVIIQTAPVAGAGVPGTLATRLTIDSVGTANFTGTIATGGSGMAVANVGANSCGTTAATIAGNSNAFVITVGTVAGTQCRVAFPIAATAEWDCVANDSTTTIAVRTTPVDTTHTDIIGAFVAADKVTGHCFPR